MENSIFRKKSIERVSSPEQLNDYIRVSNPGIWVVLIAVIVLLIGVCIWGVLGRLDTALETVAVSQNGEISIYVKEADLEKVKTGQKLDINGKEYEIKSIASAPVSVESKSFTEYAMHIGSLKNGEWVYEVAVNAPEGTALEQGIYKASVVIDSVSPMSFVFN